MKDLQFAADNELLELLEFFDAINNSSLIILETITNTFNKSIFPLALLILFIGISLAGTNERLLSGLKMAIKWLLIAFWP